jgi:chromosome segregation ATPase
MRKRHKMIDTPAHLASTGLQAMLTKSTSEQETLKAQLISAEQDIVRLREELATFHPRCIGIDQQLKDYQVALVATREQVDQARSKARLAVGTSAEGVTIQKVRETDAALANQQAIADAEEIRLAQERQALTTRETELTAQLAQRETDQQMLHKQYHDLCNTHGEIQTELGEALYGEQLAALALVERHVEDLADQLVNARVALATAREQVRATLAPWPHLLIQAQAEHVLVDDHLSRMLSGYLAYIEMLIHDAPHIKFTALEGNPFHQLIAVNEHLIHGLLGSTGASQKPLKEHIEVVRNLLQQYQRNHQ